MFSQHIPESYDYLFAKLHGMWAHAAQGDGLRRLAGSATEENFLRALEKFQFRDVDQDNFHRKILEREFSVLAKMRNHVESSMERYLSVQIENIADENLKVLINHRFFPESGDDVRDLLVEIPGRDYLSEKILSAETAEDFVAALPPTPNRPRIAEIVARLDEDRDIMKAEAALDRAAFQFELEAASGLSPLFSGCALDLVRLEIDITDCMMLLRNAESYRFPLERLEMLWIDGGRLFSHDQLPLFGEAASRRDVLDLLPGALREILVPLADRELHHSELALWNLLHHRSLMLFRDFSHPVLSVVAFPYLLHFETINLGRVFEGIRFALPFREIMGMMIGAPSGPAEG